MSKANVEKIKAAGIIGAGGAGFPTHVKVNAQAEVVLANGAECEPLLRVDRQVMETYPEQLVEGMRIVMEISGAKRGYICLKAKYHLAVERLQKALQGAEDIELFMLGNYYPAGDEQQIVYEVTGKVVPIGGLPLHVGAIVCNVSTLVNIAQAVSEDKPVTEKFVTVGGAVQNPQTFIAAIGTPFRELIKMAGGPAENSGFSLIAGGPAMGKLQDDWDAPVTKTTGGILVLPDMHTVIREKRRPLDADFNKARAVCCQCNYCSQLCPRNALGLGLEPHKAMRAAAYQNGSAITAPNTMFACCSCNLCTYYACNFGLSPGKITTELKNGMLRNGLKPQADVPFPANEAREYKKVPVKRFIARLGLSQYDVEAPLSAGIVEPASVCISLRQHIGAPAQPVVAPGDAVRKGQLIADIPEGKMGACVHASIMGMVTSVTDESITIEKTG